MVSSDAPVPLPILGPDSSGQLMGLLPAVKIPLIVPTERGRASPSSRAGRSDEQYQSGHPLLFS